MYRRAGERDDSLDAYSAFSRAHFHLRAASRRNVISQRAPQNFIYLRREHVAKKLLRHVGFDLVNFIKPVPLAFFLLVFCRH